LDETETKPKHVIDEISYSEVVLLDFSTMMFFNVPLGSSIGFFDINFLKLS